PAAAQLASTAVEAASRSAALVPVARPAGISPSAADRAQTQLTPAVNPANRPPGGRGEAIARPSAPTLSIGTIEVTLLPPSPEPPPARSAQREPPRRLSRGLGRRFGQGQV
ncbi:MAG: hypothetical protein ACRDOI_11090, partial [Trebonia sp.]